MRSARNGATWRCQTLSAGEGDLVCAMVIYQQGWPAVAMEQNVQAEMRAGAASVHYATSMPVPWPSPTGERLPLRPVWRGFVLDTLLYAAFLALLYVATRAIKARVRQWRGRSSACGYVLLNPTRGCTECGWNTAEGAVKSSSP